MHSVIIHNRRRYYNDTLYIPHPQCTRNSCMMEVKCIDCKDLFCSGCHAIQPYKASSFICYKCCSKREFKDILSSVQISVIGININLKICCIIASYSTGLVINCDNHLKCDNEINFRNKFEFDRCVDLNLNAIHHYSIDDIHKLRDDMTYNYIHGKYRRIFCFECTNGALISCKYVNCNNQDIVFNNYRNICGKHMRCESCNYPVIADFQCIICKMCDRRICNRCSYHNKPNNICPPCYEKSRKHKLFMLLDNNTDSTLGIDIMDMVIDFCIGGAIKCGNKYDCDNDVCVGHRKNLENMVDINGNKIYWYIARKEAEMNGSRLHIYPESLIMFCSECTLYKLQRCEYEMVNYIKRYRWRADPMEIKYYKCMNKEASYNICQIHPVCCVCHTPQQYKREYARCGYQYMCNECQLYAVKHDVKTQCIKVQKRNINDKYVYDDEYDHGYDVEWFVDYMTGVHRKSRGYIKDNIQCHNRYRGGNYGHKARKNKKRKAFFKRKNDKKSNAKNNRRFYKRFALSLQY